MTRGSTGGMAQTRRGLLRTSVAATAGLVAAPAARAVPPEALRPARRRPNVIVISFDDLAWNDFGCYGNDFHETPNIDALAERGMRFTQAYSAAPVCSPTRAALMTGLFPARTGITDFLRDESAPSNRYLDPRLRTVPEHVAGQGYRSVLVGKWHLTEDYSGPYRSRNGNPYLHGFETVALSEEKYIGLGDMFFPYRFMPSVTAGEDREYLTERIGADTARWISSHAQAPFFMHVSNYAIHYRWRARARLVRKYERKKRRNPRFHSDRYRPVIAAMVEHCDRQVGQIVTALRDAGIADNSLVLITSDNGGAVRASNRPLRGGKGMLYEGGIRVPLIAFWPGTVPAGTTTDAVVSTIDIAPTIKDLANAGGWGGLDGVSLAGLLTRQAALERRSHYWYYPHHTAGGVPSAAVRSGRYKLVKELRTGAIELYDLVDDPGERTNIARRRPRVARTLHRRLRSHIAEMRRVPEAPSARDFPTLSARVDPSRADAVHQVLALAGSARVERRDERLVVSATAPARVLLQSSRAPAGEHFAVTLDPGFSAQRDSSGPALRSDRPQAGIALAKDADNYLSVTYDHDRRTVGWRLVTGGIDRTHAGEPEPLDALVGTVDLSRPDARLGMSVSGSTIGVYADQGEGWEFLFLLDIGGLVDLTDPQVRREWSHAVEVGLAGGSHAADSYEIRRR
ncbi:sulfatase [Nocardioides antri]|nr:sulfatase [Nocardioides antri]